MRSALSKCWAVSLVSLVGACASDAEPDPSESPDPSLSVSSTQTGSTPASTPLGSSGPASASSTASSQSGANSTAPTGTPPPEDSTEPQGTTPPQGSGSPTGSNSQAQGGAGGDGGESDDSGGSGGDPAQDGAGGAAGSVSDEGASNADAGSNTPTGGAGGMGPSAGGYDSHCTREETEKHKAIVRDGITAVFVEGRGEVIDDYWADPYIQHNPAAQSGVDTFKSFFSNASPGFYSLTRLIGECDKVLIHGNYSSATFDMLRVDPELERMVEHWDCGIGSDQPNASGNTPLGGPTEVVDVELTGPNRELVIGFVNEVMIGGATELATNYLAPDLIEHAVGGTDGADAFVERMLDEGVSYSTIHHQIADGNFVFTLSEGEADGSAYGFYDLFRVEGGVIVEHWDGRLGVQAGASGEGIF